MEFTQDKIDDTECLIAAMIDQIPHEDELQEEILIAVLGIPEEEVHGVIAEFWPTVTEDYLDIQ